MAVPPYQGIDLSRVPPGVREQLKIMDDYLKLASRQIKANSDSSAGAAAGAAPVDGEYIVYTANATLTAEKRLTATAPVTATVGASTVTVAAPTAVVGPAGATDEHLARFNGATGYLIEDSGKALTDLASVAAAMGDNEIVRGDGGANGVQDSGVLIDDSGLKIYDGSNWSAVLCSASDNTVVTVDADPGADADGEKTLASVSLKSGIINEVGRNLRIRAWGTYVTDAGSEEITISLKFGATTATDVVITPPASSSNDGWYLCADITTATTGAPGTVEAQAMLFLSDVTDPANSFVVWNANTSTDAQTTSGVVVPTLTGQWTNANAGNTFTCRLFIVDVGGFV